MSEKFKFTYSAPTEDERREIEGIRKQFSPTQATVSDDGEDKLKRLRRLNKKVNSPPVIFAYCFGVVALLIFGLGMTMVLEWTLYLWGTVVGAFGVVLMCVTYPIYKAILSRNKKKYGQEIVALSNCLLNQNKQ